MTDDLLAQLDDKLLDGLQFCSIAYAGFESIRNSPEGTSRLRKRLRPEKKLLEEILPICNYVQASYRPGRYISVRWVNGSQQFDAQLVQRGAYVCKNYYPESAFLEVTCSMHANEYLIRELLDTKGFAFGGDGIRRLKNGDIESVPVSYTNRQFVETDTSQILNRIEEKSKVTYPNNTILIVDCTLSLQYMPDEWDDLMERVLRGLPKTQFSEIYLYNAVGQYSKSFHQHHDAYTGVK